MASCNAWLRGLDTETHLLAEHLDQAEAGVATPGSGAWILRHFTRMSLASARKRLQRLAQGLGY